MVVFFLFVLGAALGSFANAVVWRLRHNRDFVRERSECEHCHHPLGAIDLIPIVSWILLRGRCRYCHLRLSMQHPLVEMTTGFLFVALYLWWPGELATGADIASFAFWLLYLVGIAMLFLYDLHWQLLPNKILFPLIGVAALDLLVVRLGLQSGGVDVLISALVGVAVFSGFFGLLYAVSRGRWIGFGDVKLGIFMGLVLGMPLSLFALLGSYYIAAAIILPLYVAGKVRRQSKVAFGPFLLSAMVLSYFFSPVLLDWWQTFGF